MGFFDFSNNSLGMASGNRDLAETQSSLNQAGASMYGSDQQRLASNYASQLGLLGQLNTNKTNYRLGDLTSGRQLQGQLAGFDTDRGIADLTSGRQLSGQLAGYQNQRDLLNDKITASNQRFGQIMNLVGAQFGRGASIPSAGLSRGPAISTAPIYSPGAIQGQVNSQIAANDQRTATDLRNTQSRLAGQGETGASPLLAALQAQMRSANLSANNATDRETRLGLSKANADHVLAAQTAASDQNTAFNQALLGQQQNQVSANNSLLSLLGSLSNFSGF